MEVTYATNSTRRSPARSTRQPCIDGVPDCPNSRLKAAPKLVKAHVRSAYSVRKAESCPAQSEMSARFALVDALAPRYGLILIVVSTHQATSKSARRWSLQ